MGKKCLSILPPEAEFLERMRRGVSNNGPDKMGVSGIHLACLEVNTVLCIGCFSDFFVRKISGDFLEVTV
ncbi:MAG: hypothetical protein JRL30_25620 [Deltaproteobacteria bacterium]|nr:hypothetical protein [Deltaproteobacteria bacterium]